MENIQHILAKVTREQKIKILALEKLGVSIRGIERYFDGALPRRAIQLILHPERNAEANVQKKLIGANERGVALAVRSFKEFKNTNNFQNIID